MLDKIDRNQLLSDIKFCLGKHNSLESEVSKMTTKSLTVKVKIDNEEFTGTGTCNVASVDDILSLLQNKPDEVVAKYNAALEAAARAAIRNDVVSKQGAPAKAIQKLAKTIFEGRKVIGKPITMDKATELARAQMSAD